MKCIGKYSKLIAMLSLTAMMTTGCGFGSKNVVADYEIENYNKICIQVIYLLLICVLHLVMSI